MAREINPGGQLEPFAALETLLEEHQDIAAVRTRSGELSVQQERASAVRYHIVTPRFSPEGRLAGAHIAICDKSAESAPGAYSHIYVHAGILPPASDFDVLPSQGPDEGVDYVAARMEVHGGLGMFAIGMVRSDNGLFVPSPTKHIAQVDLSDQTFAGIAKY